MKLRDYQKKALLLARESIKRGLKRPVIAAPTSFGKTILAGQMLKNCQDQGKRGWFLCDRTKLVQQTIEKFDQIGVDFGVRQANHERHDPTRPIQVVSIQTLQAMINKHNKPLPEFEFAIVDECHFQYDVIRKIVEQYNNIPVIGLSATPYSRGLGKIYNNLIVPITPKELLDKGFWCPVRYYGGEHVDLSKVRSVDANTYSAQDLEKATDDDSDRLVGCIVRNWMEFGENSQTIAFSPTQNLSKNLVERFNRNGISSEHIDCYMSQDERQALHDAHNAGEFRVLSCAKLLNTGFDEPTVRCLIDCYPVKSLTTFVQRDGRLRRTHPGKEYAIYLDHASNFERFGDPENIVPEMLHDGEKPHRETDLSKKEKKTLKTQECPECMQLMSGMGCKACGYEIPKHEQVEDDGSMLVELTGKKANRSDSKELKEQFYSELLFYADSKGWKPGWAAHQYQEKYGVWPSRINSHQVSEISDITKGWIKHQNIKRAYSKSAVN